MNVRDAVLPALERVGPGSILTAVALAAAMALSPLCGHASNNDSKAAQSQQKGKGSDQKASSDRKAAEKAPDDLESCKRDADGKKGPERSRFMTACLRERK